ncbi:hypothetical protein GCM10010178_90380 [Lentzea flava]|uniref:Uncharacterized protein n=1 Tax=Lentzea flava TaxID=103732 RepID=A0ABQ2VHP8_9PSEU|nr:hypothetical protein GCM10010178_90380 [Lentzea flava]
MRQGRPHRRGPGEAVALAPASQRYRQSCRIGKAEDTHQPALWLCDASRKAPRCHALSNGKAEAIPETAMRSEPDST